MRAAVVFPAREGQPLSLAHAGAVVVAAPRNGTAAAALPQRLRVFGEQQTAAFSHKGGIVRNRHACILDRPGPDPAQNHNRRPDCSLGARLRSDGRDPLRRFDSICFWVAIAIRDAHSQIGMAQTFLSS